MKDETIEVIGINGKEDRLPSAVIDTSFFAAFLLGTDDEQGFEKAKTEIGNIVENNGIIFVPPLFWYEIGNVLLHASKPRKNGDKPRIPASDVDDIMYDLKQLPIVTRDENDLEILMRIQNLATTNGISFYDASYLELSRRLHLPLFTFNEKLHSAIV